MAAQYKQSTISGSTYQKVKSIQIRNPLDGQPSMTFLEEKVTVVGQENIVSEVPGQLLEVLTPETANTTFDILDSTTGLPTGTTMKYQDIYGILYSLYIHLATIRDSTQG